MAGVGVTIKRSDGQNAASDDDMVSASGRQGASVVQPPSEPIDNQLNTAKL